MARRCFRILQSCRFPLRDAGAIGHDPWMVDGLTDNAFENPADLSAGFSSCQAAIRKAPESGIRRPGKCRVDTGKTSVHDARQRCLGLSVFAKGAKRLAIGGHQCRHQHGAGEPRLGIG